MYRFVLLYIALYRLYCFVSLMSQDPPSPWKLKLRHSVHQSYGSVRKARKANLPAQNICSREEFSCIKIVMLWNFLLSPRRFSNRKRVDQELRECYRRLGLRPNFSRSKFCRWPEPVPRSPPFCTSCDIFREFSVPTNWPCVRSIQSRSHGWWTDAGIQFSGGRGSVQAISWFAIGPPMICDISTFCTIPIYACTDCGPYRREQLHG